MVGPIKQQTITWINGNKFLWHDYMASLVNNKLQENALYCVAISMPADHLSQQNPHISAGTQITKFGSSPIYV